MLPSRPDVATSIDFGPAAQPLETIAEVVREDLRPSEEYEFYGCRFTECDSELKERLQTHLQAVPRAKPW